MSEPHDTPQETAQGPVDPHGPGGADAPAPPGGPQRTDTPAGPYGTPPGEHESELPDESDDTSSSPGGTALQEENAERALDQPSDGSGEE